MESGGIGNNRNLNMPLKTPAFVTGPQGQREINHLAVAKASSKTNSVSSEFWLELERILGQ